MLSRIEGVIPHARLVEMSFSFAILTSGCFRLLGSPMKKSFIYTLCISAILVGSISTSSDDPSQPCLECPEDVYVGTQRSCRTVSGEQEGPERRWRAISWHEIPVVEWTCENPSACETGKCQECSALVEIQLSVGCTPDFDAAIKTPMYGFFRRYADPFLDVHLIEYLEPAVPVIETL